MPNARRSLAGAGGAADALTAVGVKNQAAEISSTAPSGAGGSGFGRIHP